MQNPKVLRKLLIMYIYSVSGPKTTETLLEQFEDWTAVAESDIGLKGFVKGLLEALKAEGVSSKSVDLFMALYSPRLKNEIVCSGCDEQISKSQTRYFCMDSDCEALSLCSECFR